MCNTATIIKRYELVEVTVPNGQTGKVNFPSIPMLRNQSDQQIIIKNIEIFTVDEFANSQINNSVPGMPITEIQKIVLGLYVNGEETIHYIPIVKLRQINGASGGFQWNFPGVDNLSNVDLDKSYIQFSAASAGGTYIVPFGFTYLKNIRNPSAPNSWIQA